MFVCICRAVPLSRVRSAVEQGARTVDEVELTCGAGGDCGTCRKEIADLLGTWHRQSDAGGRAA
jgi:bacterioferritin-associated ferredoxin